MFMIMNQILWNQNILLENLVETMLYTHPVLTAIFFYILNWLWTIVQQCYHTYIFATFNHYIGNFLGFPNNGHFFLNILNFYINNDQD